MKRFVISVLCVAVFFLGLGSLVEKTTANFKSDERALALIRQARTAIGGDANINNVRSLSITGRATKTFEIEGVANSEQGDWEMNMQLPNQLSKSLKIIRGDASKIGESADFIEKNVDVIVMKKGEGEPQTIVNESPNGEKRKVMIVKKGEGGENVIVSPDGGKKVTVIRKDAPDDNATFTTEDGKKIIVNKDVRVNHGNGEHPRQNELFRTTLSLLLSAPEGLDVNYTYAGEGTVDGAACDIVEANTGGSSYKLYLDKSSHLPRMLSYQGAKPMIFKIKMGEGETPMPEKDVKIITHKMGTPEMAEIQVKFSDYRSVNGVQFPHRWEQTIGGKADETVEISAYEINPANIAEKFNKEPQKIMIRTKKPE